MLAVSKWKDTNTEGRAILVLAGAQTWHESRKPEAPSLYTEVTMLMIDVNAWRMNKERSEMTAEEVQVMCEVADGGRRGVWFVLSEGTWADC